MLLPKSCTALGLLLLTGCEPTLTPAPYPVQAVSSGDVAGGDASGDVPVGPAPGSMTGTWVLAADFSTCVDVADQVETRARTLTRVEIVQNGQRLHEKREVCSIFSTEVFGLPTTAPQATLAALGIIQVESTVFGEGPDQGYASGVDAQLFGVKFLDPLTEPMPTSVADPRVIDGDLDGHPGATFRLGNACDLYLVQRALSTVTAVRGKDGTFTGGGVRSNEQLNLGGSSGLCQAGAVTKVNNNSSHARLVRIDGGGLKLDTNGDGTTSCAEIIAGQAQVVTWIAPDDVRCQP